MRQWDVCVIFRPLPSDPDRIIFALPSGIDGPEEFRKKSIVAALKIIRGSVDYYRRSERVSIYSWRYWILKVIKFLSRMLENSVAYQNI